MVQLESCKRKYPVLLVNEPRLKTEMSLLYAVCGLQWDGKMLRRPNLIVMMDDYGASGAFKNERGTLYKLMIKSRHKSVMCLMFALHEFANMHLQQRAAFSELMLFHGVSQMRLEKIFEDMGMEKGYYKLDQFIREYQQLTGYNVSGEDFKKY